MFNSKLWPGHLLGGLAGAVATLAFSPFDYWPLMMASVAALFVLLTKAPSPRAAAIRSLFYGLGLYGTGASWVYVSIHQFGDAPVVLAGFLTGLFVLALSLAFFVPVGYLYSRLSRAQAHWRKVLIFSGLWVFGEWLRSWLLTGFPWLISGYTLLDTPFSGLAPVTGVYGLTLLVALTGSLVGALCVSSRKQGRSLLGVAIGVALFAAGGFALKGFEWTVSDTEEPLSFSAVQGNISQDLKWEPGHLDKTVQKYWALSENQWQKDLVFWPENAIPTFYQNVPRLMEQMETQASQTDTALILGMPWYEGQDDNRSIYYNSLVGLGEAEGHYFKQKLVPFGEFVPFEGLIRGIISFFDLPMSSFSAGTPEQMGLSIQGKPVAAYICYEVVYPDFAAREAIGKDILLTVSNDTWFGTSIGPEQHFQMVRMRSLETGRYQLRVTNDGMTALIDPFGRILSSIPRYQAGVLEGEIPGMTGSTPFMDFGSWPVLILALGFVLFGRVRRSDSAPGTYSS
ncbi:apolipoprotein N-acyltransferase [Sansalvadorimonas verongulae]|uniref:apolipoprotein N-acyltransferase n=1 Tax=Sansalvadorimonas verongulae TaxID=2172824 RepID=UPI0012BD5F83|nr:apolipoprotein N-acyltransferase [Sansalvadorimonas verongulae]MTI14866.1 apolipoprotein N-acyltransferase [Sansalvadorimonas verongulae]